MDKQNWRYLYRYFGILKFKGDKNMKYPMFDKNDNAILYEHEFPIILKCEKCGKSEKFSVYFSNHISTAKAAFKYE